jgi:hypothetical protein
MAVKRKFEPEKINAALKLLRALPVKDNRKTLGETLHILKGGIMDALDKGYDRTEIRRTIAAAEVAISATTFNDFLAGNLQDASENDKESNLERKKGTEKTSTELEATGNGTAGETENPALEERKTATSENENPENIAVRLRSKKKVQNSCELWYEDVAQHFTTQGDFGLESP